MTNGYLFREYIGAQFTGVRFSDVPVNPGLSFNFILSFAIDYTPVGQQATPAPTNGVFTPFWDMANLSRADVAAVKDAHPNVSVMVGIGGDSVQDIVKVFFTPASIVSWVANSVESLSGLINEYGLDGVDVDYERFADGVDVDTFVECIGRLLTQLKARFPNITTSIASFEDPVVQRYYQPLWRDYSGVIDYVNFQFYGYGDNTDVDLYVQFYDEQVANYPGGKVLASFKTGDVTGLVTPELGISAAKELQRQGKLPGLFIWSADSSKVSSYGFDYETRAQEIVDRQPLISERTVQNINTVLGLLRISALAIACMGVLVLAGAVYMSANFCMEHGVSEINYLWMMQSLAFWLLEELIRRMSRRTHSVS